jgi:hypothetical protein
MATKPSKRYTSIKTIMEKSKKGELQTSSSFGFSNLKMFKRREVVKPYLHWLDDRALYQALQRYLGDYHNVVRWVNNFVSKTRFTEFDASAIAIEMTFAVQQDKIPRHFINDLFNFYYTRIDNIDFDERKFQNEVTYKLLEQFNNPSMKILSYGNPMKTMVVTRAFILQLLFNYALKKLRKDHDAEDLFEQIKNPTMKSGNAPQQPPQAPQQSNPSGADDGDDDGDDDQDGDDSGMSGQQSGAGSSSPGQSSGSNQSGQGSGDDADENNPTNGKPGKGQTTSGDENKDSDEDEDYDEDDWNDDDDDDEDEDADEDEDLDGDLDEDLDENEDDLDENDADDDSDSDDADSSSGGDDSDSDDYDHSDDDEDEEFDPFDPSNNISSGPVIDGGGVGKGGDSQINQTSVQQTLEDLLQKTFGDPAMTQFGEMSDTETLQTLSKMEESLSDTEMHDLWTDAKNKGNITEMLNYTDENLLSNIVEELRHIRMDMTGVKSTIKKLLDKTLSYFSAREEAKFESIFDADTIDNIENLELLHPKVKKFFLEDVYVRETKRSGKISVYVDISGSMTSSSGIITDEGARVSRQTFAMAVTLKLRELDMLNEVYAFDTRVKKKKNDLANILTLKDGGQTDINRVVDHIQNNNQNALIITDAEDSCDTYSDKAFFLGVAGCRFSMFTPQVLQKYVDNEQIVMFDGTQIYKVNYQGLPVK